MLLIRRTRPAESLSERRRRRSRQLGRTLLLQLSVKSSRINEGDFLGGNFIAATPYGSAGRRGQRRAEGASNRRAELLGVCIFRRCVGMTFRPRTSTSCRGRCGERCCSARSQRSFSTSASSLSRSMSCAVADRATPKEKLCAAQRIALLPIRPAADAISPCPFMIASFRIPLSGSELMFGIVEAPQPGAHFGFERMRDALPSPPVEYRGKHRELHHRVRIFARRKGRT